MTSSLDESTGFLKALAGRTSRPPEPIGARVGTLASMLFYGGAYAVFAVLCGIGAGIIGRGRGQSFWIWFTIGLILPLFGNLAAALSRNENDEPRRQCPRCGTVTAVYTAKCMKCGEELEYPSDDEILPSVNELRAIRARQA